MNYLTENELADLIKLSTYENVLSLNYSGSGVELRTMPSNQWAIEALKTMREEG